ncbi:Mannan endo-1,6-alpha-mannosidase [Lachnellula hyalina]|uniref:mannan endo-1,6-alpha-mannosidase n=1 Tax=Lachnellula hyalina TaxID=1316788 RepID=A0A8H8R7Q3_9HELO|nr:Mannan endo-1,6-alpha-mannosidase [Lachnellula hyalina]TVY28354.1 Mannan endo-1,6-alpha-mannosidase [Lachnellula hyalina]
MLHSRAVRILTIFFATVNISYALPHHNTRSPYPPPTTSLLNRRATAIDFVAYAAAGIDQMQTYYSASTGLWSNAWWNSANALTLLADFQEYFPDKAKPTTNTVFPTTLKQAPANLGFASFINGFYDDELWWVLAWIKVYDVTGDTTYLDTAATLFENSKIAWGTTPAACKGGLWWDKAHTSVNAVANALYITAAAKLANRRPSTPSSGYYYDEAVKATTWFMNSGMINSQNQINDGLDLANNCVNNNGPVFTYNQGIILSGLVELTWASGDDSYNELANTLATATISIMTDANGILHEACESTGGCDSNLQQFKGIFGRNIQFLYNRANILPANTKTLYQSFLQTNANAIWANDQVDNQLGLVWSGPSSSMATLQTQSSALDAIVGAAAVS